TVERPARQAVADDDRGNHLQRTSRSLAYVAMPAWTLPGSHKITELPTRPRRIDRAPPIPDNEGDAAVRQDPSAAPIRVSRRRAYPERVWNGRFRARGTADHRADSGPPERRVVGARPSGDVAVLHEGVSPGRAPCARGDDRGHGRQPVPRLHGGDRRDQRRSLASEGRGGDPQAGGPADPHVRDGLLLHPAGPAG